MHPIFAERFPCVRTDQEDFAVAATGQLLEDGLEKIVSAMPADLRPNLGCALLRLGIDLFLIQGSPAIVVATLRSLADRIADQTMMPNASLSRRAVGSPK